MFIFQAVSAANSSESISVSRNFFGVFLKRACTPADIAPLVWFRILFGSIMLWEVYRYLSHGWVYAYYVLPDFHFKYYGFSWVQAWPGWGMLLHFVILGAAALGILCGFYYRIATLIFAVGFSYVFLLDQARYLNHHYLVCLLSFLLCCVPAHKAFSWDVRRKPELYTETVPAWTVWLLRTQWILVYFMAGVAKLSSDWLQGLSIRIWTAKYSAADNEIGLFHEPWLPVVMAWSGLLFDLLVGPMLLWKRTRWLAFVLATVFHLTNAGLFNIGIFPWLSLGSMIVLFQRNLPHPWRQAHQSAPVINAKTNAATTGRTWKDVVSVSLVGVYMAWQILMPLRLWLYPGPVAWTEEGHRFSWRMLLRTKSGDLLYEVKDPSRGETWTVHPQDYLTPKQLSKAGNRPDMILQLAQHIAADYKDKGYDDVEVRALSMVSLNGRPSALLIDPDVDLAAVRRTLAPASWILPLEDEQVFSYETDRVIDGEMETE